MTYPHWTTPEHLEFLPKLVLENLRVIQGYPFQLFFMLRPHIRRLQTIIASTPHHAHLSFKAKDCVWLGSYDVKQSLLLQIGYEHPWTVDICDLLTNPMRLPLFIVCLGVLLIFLESYMPSSSHHVIPPPFPVGLLIELIIRMMLFLLIFLFFLLSFPIQ